MLIGLVTTNFQNTHGSRRTYIEYFRQFGDTILIPPPNLDDDFQRLLDLVGLWVLPGGKDIDPSRYNKRPNIFTGSQDPSLEYFDTKILPTIISQRKPIFGICRGMQSLNVLFGGNLWQDISHPYSTTSRDELIHWVSGKDHKVSFEVNSLHHQLVATLGQSLTPTLYYSPQKPKKPTKLNMVEAFVHDDLPIAGVQWHPEEIYDKYTYQIIQQLISQ